MSISVNNCNENDFVQTITLTLSEYALTKILITIFNELFEKIYSPTTLLTKRYSSSTNMSSCVNSMERFHDSNSLHQMKWINAIRSISCVKNANYNIKHDDFYVTPEILPRNKSNITYMNFCDDNTNYSQPIISKELVKAIESKEISRRINSCRSSTDSMSTVVVISPQAIEDVKWERDICSIDTFKCTDFKTIYNEVDSCIVNHSEHERLLFFNFLDKNSKVDLPVIIETNFKLFDSIDCKIPRTCLFIPTKINKSSLSFLTKNDLNNPDIVQIKSFSISRRKFKPRIYEQIITKLPSTISEIQNLMKLNELFCDQLYYLQDILEEEFVYYDLLWFVTNIIYINSLSKILLDNAKSLKQVESDIQYSLSAQILDTHQFSLIDYFYRLNTTKAEMLPCHGQELTQLVLPNNCKDDKQPTNLLEFRCLPLVIQNQILYKNYGDKHNLISYTNGKININKIYDKPCGDFPNLKIKSCCQIIFNNVVHYIYEMMKFIVSSHPKRFRSFREVEAPIERTRFFTVTANVKHRFSQRKSSSKQIHLDRYSPRPIGKLIMSLPQLFDQASRNHNVNNSNWSSSKSTIVSNNIFSNFWVEFCTINQLLWFIEKSLIIWLDNLSSFGPIKLHLCNIMAQLNSIVQSLAKNIHIDQLMCLYEQFSQSVFQLKSDKLNDNPYLTIFTLRRLLHLINMFGKEMNVLKLIPTSMKEILYRIYMRYKYIEKQNVITNVLPILKLASNLPSNSICNTKFLRYDFNDKAILPYKNQNYSTNSYKTKDNASSSVSFLKIIQKENLRKNKHQQVINNLKSYTDSNRFEFYQIPSDCSQTESKPFQLKWEDFKSI